MGDSEVNVLARIRALEAELAQLKADVSQPGSIDQGESAAAEDRAASRRDLFRYGVAALAATALGTSTAEAADGDPLRIGVQNNASTVPTEWVMTPGGQGIGAVMYVTHAFAASELGYGLYATVSSESGSGVVGINGLGTGVTGSSTNGSGVVGHTSGNTAAPAILGTVSSNGGQHAIAVYGVNNSQYSGPGPGAGGFGVYGLSVRGHGLVGATAAAGAAGVVGATNGVAGAYAGAFYGPVVVGGNFTVFNGAKSAAVPHPDGSYRRLYCIESPESWFEDFGRGTLTCGKAEVRLDPDFAAVVEATDYLVFLTGNDGRSDLSVCNPTSEGFRVQSADADGEGTFSWRVVAKRKDIAGTRLERVEIPKEPAVPGVPASAHADPQAGDFRRSRVDVPRKAKPNT